MGISLPLFGNGLLLAVMVAAGYTCALSLVAGARETPRLLHAARLGAYGTVILTTATVLCLAYAFVSHDFRLRYVAHYSDRTLSTGYLISALWGGQDGSLLWWLFLLSLYIGVCVRWLRGRFLPLQPYILATLMAVVIFFCVLMAFAADPFATHLAGPPADGDGLNPLLQNAYMIIHPPSLYIGFVGCTIPFAFAIAALATGRLSHEWIVACRTWTLFAWAFLALGNTLGMLWAYEELGWGGYWAWDPVENAALMPFLSASAFVHSVMIQERRGLFKVWNLTLVCATFFLTIFGTFLTRSGLISSVHSFAQSDIGSYFVWFLLLLVFGTLTLILYRWPELRGFPSSRRLRWAGVLTGWVVLGLCGPGLWLLFQSGLPPTGRLATLALLTGGVYAGVETVFRRMNTGATAHEPLPVVESFASREFTFLVNNWALLSFTLFVLVATTFPMVSEALWNEKVTVGPPYYNAWVQPLGLLIFALMGVGSLFGWKKTGQAALVRAFLLPTAVLVTTAGLHLLYGTRWGFPAVVWSDPLYPGTLGSALRAFNAYTPLLGLSLCAFNTAVIAQEFFLLLRARSRTGALAETPKILWLAGILPGFLYTLALLSQQGRRRYGGYVVHLGIVLMFFGFAGKSWTVTQETTLAKGGTYPLGAYTLEYLGPRMELDPEKRMIFADVRVTEQGKDRGVLSPAKFLYKKSPDSPTTEVAILHSLRDDLYLVVGTIDPQTKQASFQFHINPLVMWIWIGCLVLLAGSVICMWPDPRPDESRSWRVVRTSAAVVASTTVGILLALAPAYARAAEAQPPPLRHDGLTLPSS